METNTRYYLTTKRKGKIVALAGSNYGTCLANAEDGFRSLGYAVDNNNRVLLGNYARSLKCWAGLVPEYRMIAPDDESCAALDRKVRREFVKRLLSLERPVEYLKETFPDYATELDELAAQTA